MDASLGPSRPVDFRNVSQQCLRARTTESLRVAKIAWVVNIFPMTLGNMRERGVRGLDALRFRALGSGLTFDRVLLRLTAINVTHCRFSIPTVFTECT